ncbi:MAG: T9SS type A sorting domain-containing protein [Polaribacter sp.]
MMKKITLLLAFFVISFGYSQTVLEDFEGTAPTVAGFEGLQSATITADPVDGSNTALEIITSTSGQGWQGAELIMQSNMIDLSSDNTVKVDVYSTTAFTMFAKVEDKVNDPASAASAADEAHGGTGWETLTFTFDEALDGTAAANGQYSQIAFFPNWNGSGWSDPIIDITVYTDNITAVAGDAITTPSAQVVLEDFEGDPPTVAGFEGLQSATITADPVDGSNTALEIITSTSGQGWQGAELIMQSNMIDLSSDNTVKVDVYSTTAFTMFAKVEDKVNDPASAASAADEAHGGTGWETLTFTFDEALDGTAAANGQYSQIAFFPNWNGSGWSDPIIDITVYTDNITAIAGDAIGTPPTFTPPTTAAPTPPVRNEWDVFSVYSDAYTDITIDNFDAGWCGGNTVTEVMIASNNTQHYGSGNACQGIDFSNNKIDATGFTHLHFDFYTDAADLTGKVFNVKLVDFGGGTAEVSAFEANFNTGSSPAMVTGSWVSVDVAIDGSFDMSDIAQIGITSNLANAWYDNLYIYRAATASAATNNLLNVSLYPNPANNTLNISSEDVIENGAIYNVLGKKVKSFTINKSNASIDVSSLNTGIYILKYSVNNTIGIQKFVKQ